MKTKKGASDGVANESGWIQTTLHAICGADFDQKHASNQRWRQVGVPQRSQKQTDTSTPSVTRTWLPKLHTALPHRGPLEF